MPIRIQRTGESATPTSRCPYLSAAASLIRCDSFRRIASRRSPHCLNIGGTEARCGKVGDHNYDVPPNAVGGTLAPAVQECYAEGAVIDVESVLTAHHKGHFEMKACPAAPGEAPTQACFDEHPLAFVEDVLYDAPADPLYPERGEKIPRGGSWGHDMCFARGKGTKLTLSMKSRRSQPTFPSQKTHSRDQMGTTSTITGTNFPRASKEISSSSNGTT